MQIPKGGVAFFDSGIGGLTVLHACTTRIGGHVFYYYGDNANAPYGNLSEEKIFSLVTAAFDTFEKLEVKAAVIACNTVTAVCAEKLRARYSFPIIGAEPAIKPAARLGGDIFILATSATCKSAKFQSLCRRVEEEYPYANLLIHPCPQLAGEIEKGMEKGDFDISIHIPTGKPSAVVLGCTHYIYIKERLKRHYSCPIFDGNLGISTRLSTLLGSANLMDLSTKNQLFIHTYPKSRDEQPLFSTRQNLNKKADFLHKIYFLGDFKDKNKRIYEQMFATSGNKRD